MPISYNRFMDDSFYMNLAFEKAWRYQVLTYPNPPVGALVLYKGSIVSIEAHQKAGTSHAEILALLSAFEAILKKKIDFDKFDASMAHRFLKALPRDFFKDCELFITLEPCAHEGKTPSCAQLLNRFTFKRIVIGAKDPIDAHSGALSTKHHVVWGVEEEACQALIEPFKIWQKRAFVLFKIAQTHNGTIGCGTISSKPSRAFVHRLRSVCDLLLIGGDTVRMDRPILDSRLVKGKAPDVMIYTKRDDIDKEIPLFGIKGRRVCIGTDLSVLNKPSFILVEGGEGMMRMLEQKIDWLLTFQAPKLSECEVGYRLKNAPQYVHSDKIGEDMIIWSRW